MLNERSLIKAGADHICTARLGISTESAPERHISTYTTQLSHLTRIKTNRKAGLSFSCCAWMSKSFHAAVKFLFEECNVPSEV